MRNKPISPCAPAPLASLILSQINFAALIKKRKQTTNKKQNKKNRNKNSKSKTNPCFVLLEEVVVMNMMFPEHREHHLPVYPHTAVLCTPSHPHTYPRTDGQGESEQIQSFLSLPFSSNKTQFCPNIWVDGGDRPQPQPRCTPAQVAHGRRMLP